MVAVALVTAGVLASAPGLVANSPAYARPITDLRQASAATRCAVEAPGIEQLRSESRTHGAAPRLARLAARVGATVAWGLADLPRRRVRLPAPIGGFVPGALFGTPLAENTTGQGDAIAARIARWNVLYQPYAFEGTPDR